eukprot:Sspe_Gene.93599::Locus_66193_Transcript_1_5_Confidence_0.636_Length_506::g.93599::m.93599/K02951/RP-S12e, RPS12; small subunit ribosomal protein S12e
MEWDEEEEDFVPANLLEALQDVLKRAQYHYGVRRGLHETVKAIDKREAHLCILADDCDEPAYTALIRSLCHDHKVNLIMIPSKEHLGLYSGLVKLDKAGNVKKVIGMASCSQ